MSGVEFAGRVAAVRAVILPGGQPFTLGPAADITSVAAEIAPNGRAVVAWTTIDGGEERNERRRVYSVTGRDGRFDRPRLVDRAKHLDISEFGPAPIRLAVAPNGRALLMWATARSGEVDDRRTVRIAEAGRDGHFGTPRQLSSDGTVGDVAIRNDGRRLAVWTDDAGLRANRELVAEGRFGAPRASFTQGHPRIEWRDGAATRR
ncbi:hypothetical protein [Solirubrobacter soli]|uniref:hypothetical protein n=1 Tax=Solirubrobacter soli TaxID=363832 RepID=UPI00047F9F2D|nr:hypothetical protein [Solirubrobacter soli]